MLFNEPKFCTYLTIYSGNLLPPFYIGSTSIDKIRKGYRGSVLSKRYRSIWLSELKRNHHLFKTKIITTHDTRIEATLREYQFQKDLLVVSSPLYINLSYANKKFGMNIKGKNHPLWGLHHTETSKKKMSNTRKGRKLTETWKQNISKSGKGIKKKSSKRPGRTGKGHERSLPITIDGVTYPSRNQAKLILNVTQSFIKKYITK